MYASSFFHIHLSPKQETTPDLIIQREREREKEREREREREGEGERRRRRPPPTASKQTKFDVDRFYRQSAILRSRADLLRSHVILHE